MANSAQARKRARQAVKRRLHNASMRSRLRTHIKHVIKAIGAGDLETAQRSYRDAVPIIDSMARKGFIHKNKAARHKTRLNQRLRAMQS